MGKRKHRQIGDRTRFDEMMGPSSFKEMFWAAKPDDPDAFVGRVFLQTRISADQAPIPEPRHMRLRRVRGMVIARVLSARTLEGCERAEALLDEWLREFPRDEEMLSYGAFVLRMRSAILRGEAER